MEGFCLDSALMTYRSNSGGYYFQLHNVYMDGQEAKLKEGKPLTREALDELCRQVVPSLMADLSFLDGRVLASTGTVDGPDVWWIPPATRPTFFGGMIKLKNGSAPWPGLVLVAMKGELHIFAVKGSQRPTLETRLYVAPFFNMAGKSICLGNTPRPQRNSEYAVWESALFDSAFSEERAEKRIKGRSLIKLWRDLIQGKAKEFPEEQLLACEPKTVGELLEILRRRDGYYRL